MNKELELQLQNIIRNPSVHLRDLLLQEGRKPLRVKIEANPEWWADTFFESFTYVNEKLGEPVTEMRMCSPDATKECRTKLEVGMSGKVIPAAFRRTCQPILARFKRPGCSRDQAVFLCDHCKSKLTFTEVYSAARGTAVNCSDCQVKLRAKTQKGRKKPKTWTKELINKELQRRGVSFIECTRFSHRGPSGDKIYVFSLKGEWEEDLQTKAPGQVRKLKHKVEGATVKGTGGFILKRLDLYGQDLYSFVKHNGLNAQVWQARVDAVHGDDRYELGCDTDLECVSSSVKVPVKCKKCREVFETRLANLVHGRKGCPSCWGFVGSIANDTRAILYMYEVSQGEHVATKLGITSVGTLGFTKVLGKPRSWANVSNEQIDCAIRAGRFQREKANLRFLAAFAYADGRQAYMVEQWLHTKLLHKRLGFNAATGDIDEGGFELLTAGGNSELYVDIPNFKPSDVLGSRGWLATSKINAPRCKFSEGLDMEAYARKMAGFTKKFKSYDADPARFGGIDGVYAWR